MSAETRLLKFRAWSKDSKRMFLPVPGCDILIRIDGKRFVQDDIGENSGLTALRDNEIVLMQYSEFQDLDGQEIAHEDIVELNGQRALVAYGDGGFYFEPITSGWLEDWNFPDDSHRMRVIGNVYANRDLL